MEPTQTSIPPKGHLSVLVTILIAVIIIAGMFLYFQAKQNELNDRISTLSLVKEQPSSAAPKSNASKPVATITSKSESQAETKTATTTVTAYVASIDGNKISLDYFDALTGIEAEKAAVADGRCTQEEIDNNNGCFPNGTFYDRNVNPKLRQFTLSPSVSIITASAFEKAPDGRTNMTVSELKTKIINNKDSNGKNLMWLPFNVVINEKSEVVFMEEIFRP